MNFLEVISKMPLPRLTLTTALALIVLMAMENLPWAQAVIEFLLNMEAPK